MNNQEVFDKVVEHLLGMSQRSMMTSDTGEDFCAYRGHGGLKCAVGCLIADDVYEQSFETNVVYEDEVRDALALSGVRADVHFMADLQNAHDDPGNWSDEGFNDRGKAELRRVAHRWLLLTIPEALST